MKAKILIVTGACCLALAQDQTPVIRSTTHLVELSVVVRQKGLAVTGLTKDDFAVFDKGQEQKIFYFHEEKSDAPVEKVTLPANVFSNRVAPGAPEALPRSLTVVLLDGLNTSFSDQQNARTTIIRFLSQLRADDRLAIYTLSDRLRVLHSFSADTTSLLAALDKYKAANNLKLDASNADRGVDTGVTGKAAQLEDIVNLAIGEHFTAQRTLITAEALEAIGRHLGGFPGRKNLVWLTSGIQLYSGPLPTGPKDVGINDAPPLIRDFRAFGGEVQRAVRALNASGVAIYPVDTRGVIANNDMNPGTMDLKVRTRGNRVTDINSEAQNRIFDSQAVMRQVAEMTGGQAFIGNNDMDLALRQALSDARQSYVIAYAPTHNEWNGKYRDIKVTVKRPSVSVLYRHGYMAIDDTASSNEPARAALVRGATSELAATGLGLGVVLDPPFHEGQANLTFKLIFDLQDVAFSDRQSKRKADLELYMVVFDAQNKRVSEAGRSVNMMLRPEQYQALLHEGATVEQSIATPPGSVRLRVVARDSATGTTGALDVPLKATP